MVKAKRGLLLSTSFVSAVASILSLVSLGTHNWVESDGVLNIPDSKPSRINYGLFSGAYSQRYPSPMTYEITMTCLPENNICGLVCGKDADARQDLLKKLYNGEESIDVNTCAVIRSTVSVYEGSHARLKRSSSSTDVRFINFGAYVCTILFLVISAAFGLFSSGLSLWNTVANPIEYYFSINALYIYNSVACFTILLSILTWGITFGVDLIHNVATLYSLDGEMTTDNMANLGYSYWLNLISMCLYITTIIILFMRQYLLSKEPDTAVPLEDNADAAIYLY